MTIRGDHELFTKMGYPATAPGEGASAIAAQYGWLFLGAHSI